MTRTISALVAQFPIGLDLRANQAAILAARFAFPSSGSCWRGAGRRSSPI